MKNFRITSKNSVEHIHPQNPEKHHQDNILEKEFLDSFGNLVLLSVSQNSEYSNKSVNIKGTMFKDKIVYDSLKSYYIFSSYTEWDKKAILEHRNEMLEKLQSYYTKIR